MTFTLNVGLVRFYWLRNEIVFFLAAAIKAIKGAHDSNPGCDVFILKSVENIFINTTHKNKISS